MQPVAFLLSMYRRVRMIQNSAFDALLTTVYVGYLFERRSQPFPRDLREAMRGAENAREGWAHHPFPRPSSYQLDKEHQGHIVTVRALRSGDFRPLD